MNRTIDDLTRSCYIYGLSSLAHDSAAMMLESHSRPSIAEDVCWLIPTCDRTELHIRLVSRSNFMTRWMKLQYYSWLSRTMPFSRSCTTLPPWNSPAGPFVTVRDSPLLPNLMSPLRMTSILRDGCFLLLIVADSPLLPCSASPVCVTSRSRCSCSSKNDIRSLIVPGSPLPPVSLCRDFPAVDRIPSLVLELNYVTAWPSYLWMRLQAHIGVLTRIVTIQLSFTWSVDAMDFLKLFTTFFVIMNTPALLGATGLWYAILIVSTGHASIQ